MNDATRSNLGRGLLFLGVVLSLLAAATMVTESLQDPLPAVVATLALALLVVGMVLRRPAA